MRAIEVEVQITRAKEKAQHDFDNLTFCFGPPQNLQWQQVPQKTELVPIPPLTADDRKVEDEIRKAKKLAQYEHDASERLVQSALGWGNAKIQKDLEDPASDKIWELYDTLFVHRPISCKNDMNITPYYYKQHPRSYIRMEPAYAEHKEPQPKYYSLPQKIEYKTADEETQSLFHQIDRNVGIEILKRSHIQTIARFSQVNKWWKQLCDRKDVWQSVYDRMKRLMKLSKKSTVIRFNMNAYLNSVIMVEAFKRFVGHQLKMYEERDVPITNEEDEDQESSEEEPERTLQEIKGEVVILVGALDRGDLVQPTHYQNTYAEIKSLC